MLNVKRGLKANKMKLAKCPCGKTPTNLATQQMTGRYYYATGDCCQEWIIEYRVEYGSAQTEADTAAIDAWNNASRGSKL